MAHICEACGQVVTENFQKAGQARKKVLEILKQRPMNISEVAPLAGCTSTKAGVILRQLKSAGLIVSQSFKKPSDSTPQMYYGYPKQ